MGLEIERKYLVTGDAWRLGVVGQRCRQAYIVVTPKQVIRVRIIGAQGFLTIKANHRGIVRAEYEYEIPTSDAQELMDLFAPCPTITKTRYKVPFDGFEWDVDEFLDANVGLVVAEVELSHEDQQAPLPPWIGRDVSLDARYLNFNLALRPYATWAATEP